MPTVYSWTFSKFSSKAAYSISGHGVIMKHISLIWYMVLTHTLACSPLLLHVKCIMKQLYYLVHVFQYDQPTLLFLLSATRMLWIHIKHFVSVLCTCMYFRMHCAGVWYSACPLPSMFQNASTAPYLFPLGTKKNGYMTASF